MPAVSAVSHSAAGGKRVDEADAHARLTEAWGEAAQGRPPPSRDAPTTNRIWNEVHARTTGTYAQGHKKTEQRVFARKRGQAVGVRVADATHPSRGQPCKW